MKHKRLKIAAAAAAAAAIVGGGGTAIASSSGDDDAADTAIPPPALERASKAALAETQGGKVTETEVGDEESYYEVEVTLDNGDQVDVQLDRDFAVVGTKTDSESEPDD